ncbi:MAG: SDR family NAD(P)-dependent oxidoreductase [Alphaproteobacteria bacterium]|nr:SDR family NAD(P)-dependent oxidoreductase [Alphaproteobacteria bacterium]
MRLKDRIALVTGASRGIGRAVAERFAKEGAHVVATARTTGGLEELDDAIKAAGGTATLVPLDLAAPNGIEELGQAIFDRFKRLDVLVGNAAVAATLGPVSQLAPKAWEESVVLNMTANWRLIRSMEPLLRLSEAGRAIFVTSGVTKMVPAYFGAYTATKAGLEALVYTWCKEIEKTKIKANLLSPGAVRTSMRAGAFPGEDPLTVTPPEAIAGVFVDLAEASCQRHGEWVKAQK